MTKPALRVEDLNVIFSNENGGLKTLDNISFSLEPHEFVSILGSSGGGKSTLLRVLAGLVQPSSGKVLFDKGAAQQIGLVFQQANLMPWRTALENITLPLEIKGLDSITAQIQARAWIKKMGLQGFENTWPQDLSGGMAQRVALARALSQDPDILLLDEPFGSLDALTREKMSAELLNIWEMERKTVLMVTHSITEAIFLSDRILIFTPRPARICLEVKVDLPRPRNEDLRYTPEFSDLARRIRKAISLETGPVHEDHLNQ
ncbi:MAG: ABC transporter ATP-binding protein [Anaerolineaceae bacterium]|nr:ABC transporter ATP-binding protein [Anaerolineaceae bacterium]